ncbi:cytochrome p450 monooxygenase [Colletotrichum asianum]|uniref:Cytochrome p450 monooxygenase n=1 Tax=Colletotrichum asianum TaxID=702518 RepID=A0A8H3W379_9PEZI|nr:cytochrome p450 monooxygenase [Colletotrichum asianum]
MASSSPVAHPSSWADTALPLGLELRPHGYIITASLVVLVTSVAFKLAKRDNSIPFVDPPTWLRPRPLARMDFLKTGMSVLDKAKSAVADKPFRVLSENGDLTVLPPRFAHSIRNEDDLNFGAFIKADFHYGIAGFEPFGFVDHDSQILQNVVRKQLTKYLNTVTEPLPLETAFAANHIFGESPEWRSVPAKDAILDLVARLSSRVFLGDELCRNEAWLRVTKDYTVISFMAAMKLTFVPRPLRPLVHWFLPDCRLVRQHLAQARALINGVIEQRRAAKREAAAKGGEAPSYNDAIEWAEMECKGQAYDAAVFQLTLSFAAIHTTTDLLAQTMLFLANQPELITPLREEVVQLLKAEGWRKTALYNMKLMDSALKETQRMKPNSMFQMRRLATKDITLDEGITIRRGERVVVDASAMKDPKIHGEDVDTYDIYRFRRMREEPSKMHKAQLVTTSPEHLAFGHGQHACPGRFFASNEVKVALCHLLLKYDWKLAPGNTADPFVVGVARQINPKTVIMFRRRKEELDVDSLDFAVEGGERE